MTEKTWITKKSDSDKEEPKKESKWITKKKKEDYKEIKVSNTQSGLKEKKKWIGHKYDKKRPQGGWKD